MDKIKKVSLLFRIIFQIAFVLQPILLILFWVNFPSKIFTNMQTGAININFIPQNIIILYNMTWSMKLLGFLISLIPLILIELIFYFLIKLFRLYEKAEIFSMKNVNYIKYIGYTMLVAQLVSPLYQGLITGVLTWHNPAGHRYATISLSGTNIAIIFTAILIILISWIMTEGVKLNEEQKYIV